MSVWVVKSVEDDDVMVRMWAPTAGSVPTRIETLDPGLGDYPETLKKERNATVRQIASRCGFRSYLELEEDEDDVGPETISAKIAEARRRRGLTTQEEEPSEQ